MIKAFYTGRTGANEHQKMMSVAANNMANVNTEGFKTSNATFQELLHQRVRMPDDYEYRREQYDAYNAYNTKNWNRPMEPVYDENGDEVRISRPGDYFAENKLRVGAGGKIVENAMVMTVGNFTLTNSPLTVALANPRGFLAVMNPDGEVAYTKGGTFHLSNEGDELYLVTANGEYVLDEYYDRITIPIDINKDDIIFEPHTYSLEDERVVKLGIYTFNNIYALEHIGGSKYIPTELSNEALVMESPNNDIVRQNYVEASNANIADEMVKVIQAQRAFQSNLTVIRTADEIEAYINQLRG